MLEYMHPTHRSFTFSMALPVLWLAACGEPPAEPSGRAGDAWSNEQEVIHQTRELMRYLDAQFALERSRIEALDVPAEPAAQPHHPQPQEYQAEDAGIAPEHERS